MKLSHYHRFLLAGALALGMALSACSESPRNKLQAIQAAGVLVVVTRNSPTTYYESAGDYAGLEYDMVSAFAEELGVKARFIVSERFVDILPMLVRNEADMAAAGLAITDQRKEIVQFSTPYQTVHQKLIYRFGQTPPRAIADLYGKHIEVQAGTRYVDKLKELKKKYPELSWSADDTKEPEELLQLVWEGLVDYTIADSNVYDLNRRYYPELRTAFDVEKSEKLAWAFPPGEDRSLLHAATQFFKKLRHSGELKRLVERYYGAASVSNPINLTIFKSRIVNRLPQFQSLYEQAGKTYNVDWRLLAAIGYQESYWDPQAVSPTGVRGIMQLTRPTAQQMGVEDRLDPTQAIDGGSKYIRLMLDRLPEDITGPDRIWMALASYNVGRGHLMDARLITRQQGGDPNRWDDVKERLLLLSRYKWYSKTTHGYARGWEAVTYVTRIRNYYQALLKHDDEERSSNTSDAVKLKAPAI